MNIETKLVDGSNQIIVLETITYLRESTLPEMLEGSKTIIRINAGFAYESTDDRSDLQDRLSRLGLKFIRLSLVNDMNVYVIGKRVGRISKVPTTAQPTSRSWLHYGGGRLQVQETKNSLIDIWMRAGLDLSVFDQGEW